jgi:hypothetical protein
MRKLRQSLEDADTSGDLALKVLERLVPKLHPKSEIGGIGGGPVGFDVVHHSEEPDPE